MKTLKEYAEAVINNKNNPHALAEMLLEMSAKYAFITEIMKDLAVKHNIFYQDRKIGEKPPSDKAIELDWCASDDGGEELRAKYELKALEKLQSSIKSYLRTQEVERYNL